MSEFSDSYHLKTDNLDDGIALLQRAELDGYVYSPQGGWVTILPEGPLFEPNEKLISANTGILVHYVYGEDYAWGMELYRGTHLVTCHQTEWEPDLYTPYVLDPVAIDAILGTALSDIDEDSANRLFTPSTMDDILTEMPPYFFAKEIGLSNFKWVAFDYLAKAERQSRPLPLNVTRVAAEYI